MDFTVTAASVVSQAIGEDLFDGKPLSDPNEGKDPKAIVRGRTGGLKGGKARASKWLYGFPVGIGLWFLYRAIIFAVTG